MVQSVLHSGQLLLQPCDMRLVDGKALGQGDVPQPDQEREVPDLPDRQPGLLEALDQVDGLQVSV